MFASFFRHCFSSLSCCIENLEGRAPNTPPTQQVRLSFVKMPPDDSQESSAKSLIIEEQEHNTQQEHESKLIPSIQDKCDESESDEEKIDENPFFPLSGDQNDSSASIEFSAKPLMVKENGQEYELSLWKSPSCIFTRENPPEKIIAFDVDETLLRPRESIREERVVLINDVKIREILQLAAENKVMIALVTSRNLSSSQRQCSYYSTTTISILVDTLGKDYFSSVYYTNDQQGGNHKYLALNHLHETFYDKDTPKTAVCLVEDNPLYYNSCRDAGFSVIPVNLNDTSENNYLHQIENFIQPTVSHRPKP